MSISPKNQMVQKVNLYSKIFMSAEEIKSLASENGVEDQFANRLSLIRGAGSLTNRPLFKSAGSANYFDNVLNYLIEQLNSQIADYVAMGRVEAEQYAQIELDDFYEEFKIEHHYDRFNKANVDTANEFLQWIGVINDEPMYYVNNDSAKNILRSQNGKPYLTCAAKTFKEFLTETVDESAVVSLYTKRGDIFRHISVDGKGLGRKNSSVTIAKGVVKSGKFIRLRTTPLEM
jgi:hypothetical protein